MQCRNRLSSVLLQRRHKKGGGRYVQVHARGRRLMNDEREFEIICARKKLQRRIIGGLAFDVSFAKNKPTGGLLRYSL